MGRSQQTYFQRRHADSQQEHKKMLKNTNHQGNANQNYNEISPHTHQNGYYQKRQEITSVVQDVMKREPLCTVGGNVNWHNHYGNSMQVP